MPPPRPTNKGKTPPPEETFEEAAYLKALGEKQKPVSIKLNGGEVVRGWIEYYDRNMLRLTRDGAPNLFIYKTEILYIAEGEITAPRVRRPRTTKAAPDGPVAPLTPESSDAK
jgi:host factor-I protein